MDLGSKTMWVLNIGDSEIWITETILNTWIVMLVILAFALVVRLRMKSFKAIPSGLQNVVELIVETFDGIMLSAVSERLRVIGNWFFAVFIFILCSNLSGLFGLRPPTADWATTFALAIMSFILIQVMGIKFRKGKYIKTFFEPTPLFFPINLLGELTKPISLSFRLFGNILGGMILMTLIYSLAPMFVRFAIPVPLHAFFDVFFGALQTYIFCILSMTFIGLAADGDGFET